MKALLVLLAACGGSSNLDRGVESHLTIDHGLYGQLTESSDVGGQPDTVYPNADVRVVANGATVADTTTDASGFYELAVDPGTYLACVLKCPVDHTGNPGCCFDVTVTAGLVRQDWQSNLSGGYWCDGECPD